MTPIRRTHQADEDIIEIYLHGARNFGIAQAERYAAGLAECSARIAERPHLARERPELAPPVRLYPYRARMFAYVLDEEGVLIMRILGHRQDWERHL
ncbi:type II toxin-antitoxin system RelE/ParE family toxin [Siccirubricoccus sp. KC 17139]|uniref:Type II toxin-antitoxin system RelE/ParE family toxin n=1 Tax=Siccirubricoccus soli TaxID=2899147 RepID=A0ABT1DCX4_9PROT|nr:type II toxin-antitoxin system RelE/ParE family toxin [Siccirubricoccus soli]MCO6419764.1 type II toxin-antitoxin system RelE/ParE family toxin [Siccirubricoccus soli]MCP2685899.1 type II toxin-antitoxin system RelE/ParE family toxin [Siccirubricoccus soli]